MKMCNHVQKSHFRYRYIKATNDTIQVANILNKLKNWVSTNKDSTT